MAEVPAALGPGSPGEEEEPQQPAVKKIKVGFGHDPNLRCGMCGLGSLVWKPGGKHCPNKFFLGCSRYRSDPCTGKGLQGQAFDKDEVVTVPVLLNLSSKTWVVL